MNRAAWVALAIAGIAPPALAAPERALSMAEILAHSPAGDWRMIDPADTLYLDLARGRVIIELAPRFAPRHVSNIESPRARGLF